MKTENETDSETVAADARLIAAAPDLLNAAKMALDLIQTRFPLEHGARDIGEAWGALETAIAKAEQS